VRAPTTTRRGSPLATRAVPAGALAAVAVATPAAAAPPPCGGTPQIADAVGDGHHHNTDLTSAWLSEQAGRLQAVIQPRTAVWEPAHDDSEAAGFALLFQSGGQTRYVRAEAPRSAPVRFDHGTWSPAGGFASLGPTTGEAVAGPGGAVTIDVPGVAAGTLLTRIFVLTYDGGEVAAPHWVDRAPGGVAPSEDAFGADYVVGACPAGGGPGTLPGGAVNTTAVALHARRRVVGGGRTEVSGHVVPARAGVAVEVTASGRRSRVRRTATQADGSFSLLLPVGETTRVRAVAEGIASQTRTITVVSTVRITVRQRVVTGTVRPALPGRVLLLRGRAVEPTAKARPHGGRFRVRLRHPRPGRYQAVFIPSGRRAERSTSNTGVIR
jgi:hypothetical protein